MTPTQLQSQKVVVVGLGVSGRSVVRYLSKHRIEFDIVDERIDVADVAADPLLADRQVFNELTAERVAAYDVLVLSPGIPRAHPALAAAIERGQPVIGDVELFASVVNATVIAVTGSNGKSTVVAWATDVLISCGVKAVACGNIGEPVLDALSSSIDVYVVELSSYQLESSRTLAPMVASVLNISEDHLDRYASLDAYADVKAGVYQHARHCLVNAQDYRTWPRTDTVAKACVAEERQVRFFNAKWPHSPDVVVNSVTSGSTVVEQGFGLRLIDDAVWLCDIETPVLQASSLSLPGEHNVANALAVLGLIAPLNLDSAAIAAAIPHFAGLPHRTQFVRECGGVRFYNDSKGTNVDACIKAITAMPGPVILIAGGQGKGADFQPLAAVVAEYVTAVILIGQDRQRLADVLPSGTMMEFADTLEEAVIRAAELANRGDVVLLSPACASFDMFRSFEARGEQFMAAVESLAA